MLEYSIMTTKPSIDRAGAQNQQVQFASISPLHLVVMTMMSLTCISGPCAAYMEILWLAHTYLVFRPSFSW